MSKDARYIMETYALAPEHWIVVETCVLRHSRQLVASAFQAAHDPSLIAMARIDGIRNLMTLMSAPPTMPDFPGVDLVDRAESFGYVCREYVTHDFGRVDALKAALLVRNYPESVIRRLGDKCKALGHFEISYLSAALENEGAAEIEVIRRESRLNELIAKSERVEPPPHRFPGLLRAQMHENAINDEIEQIQKG